MTPFLVACFLAYQRKTMFAQDANDVLGCANRKALVDSRARCSLHRLPARRIHLSATSKTFAPAGKSTGAGSNQSSRASFAFWIASSSVSPAEAQPGNSGKNAAQRFVSESCSTTSRNFMSTYRSKREQAKCRRPIRLRSGQDFPSRTMSILAARPHELRQTNTDEHQCGSSARAPSRLQAGAIAA